MTKAEAIQEQRHISMVSKLEFYFGTNCEKCCEVYPRLCRRDTNDKYHDTYYKCDVCGKRTEYFGMPWVAAEAWNKHEYAGGGVQINMFMEGEFA